MSDISPDTITPTDESNSQQSEPSISETFPPAQASSSPFQKTQSTSNESFTIESERKKKKKWILPLIVFIVAVVALVPGGYFYYQNTQLKQQVQITDIDSYEECLNAQGSRVQSSDKTVCTTIAGIDFVNPIPESEAANDYPSPIPTHMAQIQEKDGFVIYSEPFLGYTFKYKASENLEGEDCSNGRYQIFNPNTIPPNSDEPCGSHGISDLGVSGNIKAISFDTQSSFCKQTEESSWRMKLSTESINGNDVSICKYSFIGERLYPGPDEFWEALVTNDESQVMIDLEDLEFTDLFYEILSTFEFTQTTSAQQQNTYINYQYKFKFQYPANLMIMDNSEHTSDSISVGFQNHQFMISVYNSKSGEQKNYLNMPKIAQKIINNLTWDFLYFDSKSPMGGGPQSTYQIFHQGFQYIVNFNDQSHADIDQILSTFEFIEN